MAPRPDADGDDHYPHTPPPPPPPSTTPWPKYVEGYSWDTEHSHTSSSGDRLPKTTITGDGWTSVGFDTSSTTGTYPFAEQTGSSTQSSAAGYGSSFPQGHGPGHHPPPQIFAAAGAMTALIVVGLLGLACFVMRKKKKNQRRASALQMAENAAAPGAMRGGMGSAMMGAGTKNVVSAHVASPTNTGSYMAPPTTPPPALLASPSSSSSMPSTSGAQQPVILSRTMDQSYYTGIDTSDHISLAETRSHSSGETYVEGDEPPPPYRPASVPPISRDNSVRLSTGITLDRTLRNSVRQIRSPFDDPEEEDVEDEPTPLTDATSNPPPPLARPLSRRDTDAVSVNSEFSYQPEETRPHSNL
jgi:hypothetical protein